MAKKPVLVVMAAGMGSRYGGLKQIDPVGSCGEAILDYSLYDAYQAGFETAVIIIKEAIRKDFMDTVGKRLKDAPSPGVPAMRCCVPRRRSVMLPLWPSIPMTIMVRLPLKPYTTG